MSLPRLAVRRDKVTAYLLDPASHDGASKAKFFLGRGFSRADWIDFVEALGRHGADHRPG